VLREKEYGVNEASEKFDKLIKNVVHSNGNAYHRK
jgi:hypothetical protein